MKVLAIGGGGVSEREMTFYRVSYPAGDGSVNGGFSWHLDRGSANVATNMRDDVTHDAEVEAINIDITVNGVLAALNRYAVHPDNG